MNLISAVIISCNEADRIENCLKSLNGIADEIILVDCGSTDGTQALALKYGAKVYQQDWLGYGAQKNFGICKAKHDYILSLDCDERLDDTLRQSIHQLKTTGLRHNYEFRRLNNYYGKFLWHGADNPDYKLRLWNKHSFRWDDKLVHETLRPNANIKVKRLKGFLLHFTFTSEEKHLEKMERYATEAARQLFNKGKKNQAFKIIANPVFSFFNGFILHQGFLDGLNGFKVAKMNARYTYLKYMKLSRLWKNVSAHHPTFETAQRSF